MGKQPTDSKIISKERMAEGFKRALSNYLPVLKNIDDLDEKYPGKYKEEYPEGWTDPLELYGCYLNELHLTEEETAKERIAINEFIGRHNAKWVWENRMRLVAEKIYIHDYF
jgi:hypothetical protein